MIRVFGRSNFFNSEIIKKYLDDYYKKVVDQLDNGQKIKRDKFCDLIDEYFNSLGFYGDGVNDENIVLEKEAIENIFSYVSQLKLNNKNNYEFVSNFLKRLSNYNGNESSAFYDLLMSNSIKDSKAMRDFLTYKDNSNEKIMTFVNNLYKVVDDLDKVDQDKIDYIFHSSYYFQLL